MNNRLARGHVQVPAIIYLSQPLPLHYTLHSYALAAQYKLISKQTEFVMLPVTLDWVGGWAVQLHSNKGLLCSATAGSTITMVTGLSSLFI